MKYTVEVIRAKDGLKKSCITSDCTTEEEQKKCFNSYDLFYRAGQFKAYKITDENGLVAVKKGDI